MISLLSSRRRGFRGLCWLMAMLMFATPSLPVLAQENNQLRQARPDTTLLADPASVPAIAPLDVSYMLPQACAVVSVRPRQLLTSPAMQMLPIEVLQAASLQQTGLDPLQAEMLLLSVEPPMVGPPNYSAMAVFTPAHRGKLHPQLTAHTQPGQLDGREYLKSQHPLLPSFLMIDGNTMLAAPDMTLQKFFSQESSSEDGLLLSRLKGAAADDLYVAVDLGALRPMINQLLMQAQGEVPPEFQPFLTAPDLIRLVELRLNFSGMGPTELVVEANSAADASKLLAMLEQAVDMWRSSALAVSAQLKQDPDPVQQALGRYQERMMNQTTDMLMPEQDGARLVLFRQVPGEGDASALTTVAISGILVALLLPAVQAAREAARRSVSVSEAAHRNESLNNMKQIMLALLNYEDRHKSFPTHASYDENGKPLLSWRVHILPELEENELYRQFHLDEPWDSEHNRKLIAKMPQEYLDPSSGLQLQDGKTHYLGIKGEGFAFEGTEKKFGFAAFRDGSFNTAMVLQVNDQRATTWTKPDDWELNEKNPLEGLTNSLHPGVFLAGFADGHGRAISESVDVEVFKAILTRAGGEVVDLP